MPSDDRTRAVSGQIVSSRRTFLRTAAAATGAFAVAGCAATAPGGRTDTPEGGRTVTDGVGRTVTVPAEVSRVVCVGPGTLRQVAYLGATDRVVGVERGEKEFLRRAPYNMANPELRDRPTIGSTGPNASGNGEEILAVDPDVIFYFGDPSVATELTDQTNTPVVVLTVVDFLDRDSRQTMYETWRLVGRVLDETDRAETLVDGVEDVVGDLGARTNDRPESERRRAYIGAINNKGAKGIDTTRNPFPPFRLTGTENVAAAVESDSASVQVSTEKLLAWDPPRAFVSTRNTERVASELRENPELRQVSAVADGEVFKILPYAQYHVNYESILATSYYVGRTVYPEAFGDVSVKAKANEVFRLFHDTDLYEDLASTFDMFEPLSIPGG